jgi:DNA-binding SARP family transcriptional activator
MQREPTAREQLATLLWGDRFDTQARQSLRQCLLSLRGELVGLKAQLFSTDAHEFAALAEKGADLERALVHYRGEFLAACVVAPFRGL